MEGRVNEKVNPLTANDIKDNLKSLFERSNKKFIEEK
jgi:hypothetical protein